MIGLFLFKVGDIHFRQLQMDGIFFFLALSVFSTTKRGIGVLDLRILLCSIRLFWFLFLDSKNWSILFCLYL